MWTILCNLLTLSSIDPGPKKKDKWCMEHHLKESISRSHIEGQLKFFESFRRCFFQQKKWWPFDLSAFSEWVSLAAFLHLLYSDDFKWSLWFRFTHKRLFCKYPPRFFQRSMSVDSFRPQRYVLNTRTTYRWGRKLQRNSHGLSSGAIDHQRISGSSAVLSDMC